MACGLRHAPIRTTELAEWPTLPRVVLCLVTTIVFGAVSAALVLGTSERGRVKSLLPAGVLLVLLAPGVALQSVDTSPGVFLSWLGGTAAGAYLGVILGARARTLLAGA